MLKVEEFSEMAKSAFGTGRRAMKRDPLEVVVGVSKVLDRCEGEEIERKYRNVLLGEKRFVKTVFHWLKIFKCVIRLRIREVYLRFLLRLFNSSTRREEIECTNLVYLRKLAVLLVSKCVLKKRKLSVRDLLVVKFVINVANLLEDPIVNLFSGKRRDRSFLQSFCGFLSSNEMYAEKRTYLLILFKKSTRPNGEGKSQNTRISPKKKKHPKGKSKMTLATVLPFPQFQRIFEFLVLPIGYHCKKSVFREYVVTLKHVVNSDYCTNLGKVESRILQENISKVVASKELDSDKKDIVSQLAWKGKVKKRRKRWKEKGPVPRRKGLLVKPLKKRAKRFLDGFRKVEKRERRRSKFSLKFYNLRLVELRKIYSFALIDDKQMSEKCKLEQKVTLDLHVQLKRTRSLEHSHRRKIEKMKRQDMVVGKYVAQESFVSTSSEELGFHKGQTIYLCEKSQENWWFGKMYLTRPYAVVRGFFPKKCVVPASKFELVMNERKESKFWKEEEQKLDARKKELRKEELQYEAMHAEMERQIAILNREESEKLLLNTIEEIEGIESRDKLVSKLEIQRQELARNEMERTSSKEITKAVSPTRVGDAFQRVEERKVVRRIQLINPRETRAFRLRRVEDLFIRNEMTKFVDRRIKNVVERVDKIEISEFNGVVGRNVLEKDEQITSFLQKEKVQRERSRIRCEKIKNLLRQRKLRRKRNKKRRQEKRRIKKETLDKREVSSEICVILKELERRVSKIRASKEFDEVFIKTRSSTQILSVESESKTFSNFVGEAFEQVGLKNTLTPRTDGEAESTNSQISVENTIEEFLLDLPVEVGVVDVDVDEETILVGDDDDSEIRSAKISVEGCIKEFLVDLPVEVHVDTEVTGTGIPSQSENDFAAEVSEEQHDVGKIAGKVPIPTKLLSSSGKEKDCDLDDEVGERNEEGEGIGVGLEKEKVEASIFNKKEETDGEEKLLPSCDGRKQLGGSHLVLPLVLEFDELEEKGKTVNSKRVQTFEEISQRILKDRSESFSE